MDNAIDKGNSYTGNKIQITAKREYGIWHWNAYTSKRDQSLVKDAWFWNGGRQMPISSFENLLTWNSGNTKQVF